MIWTDNMLIPKKGDVYTASVLMNYYYDPAVAAKVEAYVNYICPVKGADVELKKTDPDVAKNPLIFPTDEMLSNVHQFDSAAAQKDEFKTKFAQLTGS
jgi:spermidine/putrescine transport system substrate-binding protein